MNSNAKNTLKSRRRLLSSLIGLPFLWAFRSSADSKNSIQQINVLTSYPEEVMSIFERAFEKKYPQYRIRFLWRMPHDALPYLQAHARDGSVDVYWAASPRTFDRLKTEGLLRPITIQRNGLPARIGNAQISDPDAYYLATELAGYVFAINDEKLSTLNLSIPSDWPALANPKLLDNIALPVPSEVGFAPVMFDIVLQAYGWEHGWALWSEIASLAQLSKRGSTFITDTIGAGQVAIGLSIDFFVNAAIANGAKISAHYPQHNGVNPGHIAWPAVSGNNQGAAAFTQFVLSPEGQALLTQRDIRKLPARPSVYTGTNAPFNPFAAAANGTLNYDGERGRSRLAVISSIFDQMLALPHQDIRQLWQRVYAAEDAGKSVAHIRTLLSAPPITEAKAESDIVTSVFRNELEGAITPRQEISQLWGITCAANRAKARTALDILGA